MPSPLSDPSGGLNAQGALLPFSVVVPVYNNESSLPAVVDRLEMLSDELGAPVEAVFVVDGSPDGSVRALRHMLPSATIPSQVLILSRNFGSIAAVRAGMAATRGKFVAVMAADLQEPAELLTDFFRMLLQGEYDVVVGVRSSRHDGRLSSLLSRAFWVIYRQFVLRDIPPGGVDVFACSRGVLDQITAMVESHSSLIGLLYWAGFRRVEVPYERQPRKEGRSGWTFQRRVRYMSDSIYSFTDLPITFLVLIGSLGVMGSLAAAGVVFGGWLAGDIHSAGYTPIMIAILLSSSAVILALGIVGSYVWRTYENSKERPGAIVAHRQLFRPGSASLSSYALHEAAEGGAEPAERI